MGSQLDLDQGGTYRQTERVYLGPSVGWVEAPNQWVINVTSAGTTTLLRGTNVVLINFNGSVSIQLPLAKATGPSAIANPQQFSVFPLLVADVGGFASANPIFILPSGAERIDGQASLFLSTNYGVRMLRPDIVNGGWLLLQ